MLKNAERFFSVYSSISLEERKLPIVIIEDKPINWNLAYEYIENETEIGKKILKQLIDMEII